MIVTQTDRCFLGLRVQAPAKTLNVRSSLLISAENSRNMVRYSLIYATVRKEEKETSKERPTNNICASR
jgi:hypothetical protein